MNSRRPFGHSIRHELHVRVAVPGDADALGNLHVATWRAAYHDLMPEETLKALSVETRVRKWRDILEIAAEGTLVAETDGRVSGFVSFGASRDPDAPTRMTGEIYALYVAPEYWNRGVGWKLWTEARGRLCRANFAAATLWVLEGNARGRSFYERVGFAIDPDAIDTFRFGGIELPEVRYRIAIS